MSAGVYYVSLHYMMFLKSKELVCMLLRSCYTLCFLPDYSEEQEGQGDYIIYYTYIHTYIGKYIHIALSKNPQAFAA